MSKKTKKSEGQTSDLHHIFSTSTEEIWGISVRAYNGMKNSDIRTIGDLVQKSEKQMLLQKNFGRKSLGELRDFLSSHQLRFGMTKEDMLQYTAEHKVDGNEGGTIE